MAACKPAKIISTPPDLPSVRELTEAELGEALAFLAERPLDTVIMAGWLREHGVVSPNHRGIFYVYRDRERRMKGIALIGRNTIFEARTTAALKTLAECARGCAEVRMMFAETARLLKFWHYFASPEQVPRKACSELLFDISSCPNGLDPSVDLRTALPEEIEQVVEAHAAMVVAETGVNPLEIDPDGFRSRCAERIRGGRVWVWVSDGKLLFKTDVVSETPEAVYIEGLWVDPAVRRRGVALRCLGGLCGRLLDGSNAICGFVDLENKVAQSLYRKVGFTARNRYKKVYI